MKAVILAAGKSTRMYPLTITRPKPLLKILNKTILEHNLDSLKGIIDDAIIVVGYKKKMIIDYFGTNYNGINIIYVEQKEQKGTGDAILCVKEFLEDEDKFLIMPGDDLFSRNDIKKCLSRKYCVLAKVVDDPEKWGVFLTDKNDNIVDIEEKPEKPKSNLASTGLMVMNKKIIQLMEKQNKTKRGEYELTCALGDLIKEEKVFCQRVEDYWLPIGYPWHVLEANAFLLRTIKSKIHGKIEDNATIKGELILEKGSVIKSGAYIEGPAYIGKNTIIGPHAYIRPDTVIGDNCNIRSEVYDSLIMEGTTAKHTSYLGHSVIGQNVNIGAGTITGDYRHDGKNNITLIKGMKVDTKRRKLGSFIGDKVHTGIGTLIYPGRKMWPNTSTLPGEIVKKDKEND